MNIRHLFLIASIASLVLYGCSNTSHKNSYDQQNLTQTHALTKLSQKTIKQRFNRHYSQWKGVPYEFGGNDKRGVDCSGFIHVAFKKKLNVTLPRTTELLAQQGSTVKQKNLKVGDLVFFRTGFKKRHAGIYIGNNYFMHASTSKGVMKSKLSNPYWRKHYWQSRRVLTVL